MKVLLVDDHPTMLEYLGGAVQGAFAGAEVRTAADLDAGLRAARAGAPDLVVLDLGLPGCAGIDALLKFRRALSRLRIAVFSASEDGRVIRGALAAGAAGFIPKTSRPRIVAGQGLTGRQREVLARLLQGRSVAQVAKELGIAPATAKHHAHAVYAAFGVRSRADLIVAASRRAASSD